MSAATEKPQIGADERRKALHKAAAASFIGNFIEWFDYASYGYLVAVIGVVFFPESDESVQLLSAFAIFAMSFIFRPIGAVLWGNWGDRFGRRWALSWSILIMSASTFLVGLLPGYATIGILAPIALLILRSIQGFSASGEYAGAATFLAEFAPPRHRGLYTALVPASTAAGLLGGSLMISGLFWLLDDASMHAWGWRVPFVMALPLGFIGRYIRVHLEDSPVFQEMKAGMSNDAPKATPLRDLFRHHAWPLAIAFGVSALNAVAFYLLLSYMPTYVHGELGLGQGLSTIISSVMLTVYVIAIGVMGYFSDRIGRRVMLVGASIAFVVLSVPLLWLMGTKSVWVILLCEVVFAIILTANDGTLATFLAESFPTEVRYSGFALAFNGANALLGGTAPFIATWLIQVTGSRLAPAIYLSVIAFLALIAMLCARDNSKRALSSIE
ncbi:MFS transporter [Schaalia suimastitidis]|uniref:MFS transporter n=1 Tax=Schaalia suimastitidis TaxID=121163 RepID=UPI00040A3275|nr:MFS transporter [Schaalia suimastitidis]